MTDFPKWFCAMTAPRAEAEASTNLRRAGFMVFYPFVRAAERRKQRGTEVRLLVTMERPLFPRYTFFALRREGETFHAIKGMAGVSCIVRSPFTQLPLQIPSSVITRIMDWAGTDGCCPTEAAPHWFQGKPGDLVECTDGAFQGFVLSIASVAKLDDDEINVWVSLLGREVQKPVPLGSVKLVEARA